VAKMQDGHKIFLQGCRGRGKLRHPKRAGTVLSFQCRIRGRQDNAGNKPCSPKIPKFRLDEHCLKQKAYVDMHATVH
jgi:hypothetical protein